MSAAHVLTRNLLQNNHFAFSALSVVMVLVGCVGFFSNAKGSTNSTASGDEVFITMLLDDLGQSQRWNEWVIQPALQELRERHPRLNITLDFRPVQYEDLHPQFLESMSNRTNIDIIGIDPTWLGEFVERGFLADLTDRAQSWKGLDDLYQEFLDAGVYEGKIYGIYIISDLRALWYWKDLLSQAGVDPKSLQT